MESKPKSKWGLGRLGYRLTVFAVINCIAVNLVLLLPPLRLQPNTTLQYTGAFFGGDAEEDSWRVMREALQYLHESHDETLYSKLFFEQKVKFIYPPTSLLFFEPLRQGPFRKLPSNYILNLLSWLAVAATAMITARIFVLSVRRSLGLGDYSGVKVGEQFAGRIAQIALPAFFALTFYPVVKAFNLGQTQAWIDLFFAGAVLAWITERKGLSGALSGLICIIKPQLGLLLLWGLLRKQHRFVAGWTLVVVILVGLSLGLYGLANHVDYLRVITYLTKHGECFYPNQSVNGLLNRSLFNGINLEWDPQFYPPYNLWVHLGTVASSILIVVMALFWKRKEARRAELTDLLIAALSFTIASPIVWEHHYGVLIPMFAAALPATLATPGLGRRGIVALAAAFVLSSNYYSVTNRLAESPFNVLQSYLLLGGIVLLVHLYRLRHAQQMPAEARNTRAPRRG